MDEERPTQGLLRKVSGFLLLALGSKVAPFLGKERGCVSITVWNLRFQKH